MSTEYFAVWSYGHSDDHAQACFLQRVRKSALLAMPSAVLARRILSVRPSVRHVPVLCPDE